MNFNVRFTGSGVLALALLAGGAWLWHGGETAPVPVPTIPPAPDAKPKVIPTNGGQLTVAHLQVAELFTKTDSKEIFGIPLGTTTSEVRANVHYRYYIEMQRKWPIEIDGKTATIFAPPIKSSLPVAFDTSNIYLHTENGWARFNKTENLNSLVKSISKELEARANSPQYEQTKRDAARTTVKAYVTTWLLKQQQGWGKSPEYKVIVLFPGESLAEATAKDSKDQQ